MPPSPSNDSSPQTLLNAAVEIARAAGGILRQGYGQAHAVEFKGSIDLVTEFDRRSETLILDEIARRFPGHAVLAEESGARAGGAFQWLVDPLDGTTNFAHGLPFFSISLAVLQDGRLTVGVVYDPIHEEMFTAVAGEGARLNGAPIQVSPIATLDRSLLITGFPYDLRTNPDNNLDHFDDAILRAQAVRRLGSAALDLAYVASGRAEGYWELRLNPWDIAAGSLLVLEAGGHMSDFQGGDTYLTGESVVGTNGLIHDQLLQVLRAKGG